MGRAKTSGGGGCRRAITLPLLLLLLLLFLLLLLLLLLLLFMTMPMTTTHNCSHDAAVLIGACMQVEKMKCKLLDLEAKQSDDCDTSEGEDSLGLQTQVCACI